MTKTLFLITGGVVVIAFVLYLACFHYTEPTQVGISLNYSNGNLVLVQKSGWSVTAPWIMVAKIDTRPIRVCVTSSGRGFNCKLVQFNPQAYQEFVEIEGFRYYWWANRLSFNLGYSEEYRGMRDILRGHAFGVKKYRFLKILQESK